MIQKHGVTDRREGTLCVLAYYFFIFYENTEITE